MGPGKDLDMLAKHYQVTGSDLSGVFLDLYRKKHKDADLLLLDAVSLKTDREWQGIYSNKVLHHLSKEELSESLISAARDHRIARHRAALILEGHRGRRVWRTQGLPV